jgi:tRNA-specific 2-thiouridylase
LQQASDKTKDQSYFLYRLTQKDLAKIIFPLGNHKKSEVKKLAGKMKLPTLEEESQDICFLLGQDISSYLGKCIKTRKGNIIDSAGKVLGKHKGLPFYTLGQRKGIKIGPPSPRLWRARGTGPYFVVGKNLRRNELVVTNDPEKLLTRKFFVSGVNWVSVRPKFPLRARVQTRYRAGKFSAIIREVRSGKLEVRSEKYLRAVTAGQSAVFYKNGEVLGGGIINHAN